MSTPLPPNESRGSRLIATQWITVSIASLLVFLRMYARAFLRKIAGADDWTIVIALGFAIAQSVLTGFQISKVILITTIEKILNSIGTCLVRVSVCLFVLRLVPRTHREFYKYTYILIAVFAVITTATLLLILLRCIPIEGTWNSEIKARCIPRSDLNIVAKTQGSVCAVMDLLCVCLPIFFLRNLQAKPGRKISLFVLLGLGLFTAACAILRTSAISFENEDYTWHNVPVSFWACLEQNVGVIVASVPAVHHLCMSVLRKTLSGTNCNGKNNNSYPRLRSLTLYTESASDGSPSERGDRGSPGAGLGVGVGVAMEKASSGCVGAGGRILSPPSPTTMLKKEPRLDYDSPTLDVSPKLEQEW